MTLYLFTVCLSEMPIKGMVIFDIKSTKYEENTFDDENFVYKGAVIAERERELGLK